MNPFSEINKATTYHDIKNKLVRDPIELVQCIIQWEGAHTIGDRGESIIGILAAEARAKGSEGVVVAVQLDTLDKSLVANNGTELGCLLTLHASKNLALNKDSESLVQPKKIIPLLDPLFFSPDLFCRELFFFLCFPSAYQKCSQFSVVTRLPIQLWAIS